MKLVDYEPLAGSGDVQVRAVEIDEPGFDGIQIQALNDAGVLLGSPLRLTLQDGRMRGDTPGVNGTYFHVNGAGQIELVGR